MILAAGNTKRIISTLEYIRNINFQGDRGEAALHKAVDRGHEDIVQLLLKRGASVQATDQNNNTLLHLAKQGGHYTIVELLLKEGAEIEAVGQDKFTALHLAAWLAMIVL